ncbi:MAG: Uma2 family endonuclease [Lachnospiraceae bacterium]|nr:Uma2 family endonuclease [Lachnospiraceae bacterium]
MKFEKGREYTHEDYMKLPEDVRVELIDGVFYEKHPSDPITGMAAPNRKHQELVSEMVYRIRGHIEIKGSDCEVYPAPFAVRLKEDDKNTVEPDVSVICDPSKLTDEGCMGVPEWIIEIISPGNPGHDYIRKLNLYLNAGVIEYWIIDPIDRLVSVYEFGKGITTPKVYAFDEEIPAGICDDLKISLSKF